MSKIIQLDADNISKTKRNNDKNASKSLEILSILKA